MKCERCGTEFEGNFCPNCGQAVGANPSKLKEAPPVTPDPEPVHIAPKKVREMRAEIKQPFYSKTWFIILTLIFIFPLGLFLMWKYEKFNKPIRVIVTVLIVIGCCINISSILANSNSATTTPKNKGTKQNGNISSNETAIQQETTKKDTTAVKNSENNIISFDGVTVVDNDECTIKITKIDPDNMWGYTLKAVLENKSSDKTYMFSVTNAAIDGVQCDPGFASEVAPGKKANKDISFSNSALKENGISDFSDIEILFRVYDSNDWTADNVAKETVHVYPYGEEKATVFTREPKDSDKTIIDNDNVTVIVTGYTEDDIWGYTVNLFLINKTDKEVMFSVEDASVNGYMSDPFYASSVLPKKCAFSSMSWGNSSLEENNIEKVEKIEFTLKAYDSDHWAAEPYAREVITLTP